VCKSWVVGSRADQLPEVSPSKKSRKTKKTKHFPNGEILAAIFPLEKGAKI
jgi:hypothetical protein